MRLQTSHMSGRLRQLIPQDLGGRLVWTVVLLCLVTVALTIIINGALITWQTVPWRQQTAIDDASGLSGFVVDETEELQTALASLASGPPLTGEALQRARDFLDATDAAALVVVDLSGKTLVALGSGADVGRLTAVASGMTANATGLLAMPGGVSFVAGRSFDAGGGRPAYALASLDFDKTKQARFESIASQVHITLRPPAATALFDGATPLEPTPNVLRLGYRTEATDMTVLAQMQGIDGQPAAIAELVNLDERTRRATSAAIYSSLISGLLAIVIGVSLGLALARIIGRPVERLVDHVKTQGYLAVEGAPFTAESSLDDPTLPTEFRELGAVVEDLLRHLATRQSELKVAIAKTQYAEESLGIVVSESREAKIVLQDGRVAVANPSASVALGLPQALLMERTLSDVLADAVISDEHGLELDPVTLLESALEQSTTVQLARPGQAPRWHIFQAARHADDLHNRILITAQDVTEDRRLQQIRSEIVSLISHDLRSPLAVVIGYLDLLRKPLSEEDRDKAIESAKRNAGRMADLLEDLLSATRAEELLAPTALMPVMLAELVEEVASSLAPTHTERVLTVEATCRPVVRGEEKRLRQVLVNLITNAFKYAPDDMPVTVRVTCLAGTARLQVVDHGPGVPVEDRERVFDRYTRLDGSSGRPGVGLGLYIVRIISENHGGAVRVDETEGGGATFVVELPCAGAVVDGVAVLGEEVCPESAVGDPQPPAGT
jgi:signal transduction histidine kinase